MSSINAEALVASIVQHYPRASFTERACRSWVASVHRLARTHTLTAAELRWGARRWMDTQAWPPQSISEVVNLILIDRRRNVPTPDPDDLPVIPRRNEWPARARHLRLVLSGDRTMPAGIQGTPAEMEWHNAQIAAEMGGVVDD